jgi:hypothetical protein
LFAPLFLAAGLVGASLARRITMEVVQ